MVIGKNIIDNNLLYMLLYIKYSIIYFYNYIQLFIFGNTDCVRFLYNVLYCIFLLKYIIS